MPLALCILWTGDVTRIFGVLLFTCRNTTNVLRCAGPKQREGCTGSQYLTIEKILHDLTLLTLNLNLNLNLRLKLKLNLNLTQSQSQSKSKSYYPGR
jgi:hypothetical protein